MKSIGLRTLVLNADMMPVNMLTLRANRVEDAIVRILNETCVTIECYDRVFSTAGGRHHIPVPSVMMRTKYFKRPKLVQMNRSYLLLRDGFKCIYCRCEINESNMTYEHFIPQSKGGATSWSNILASCARCNHKLGNLPANKKKPHHKPYAPSYQKLVSLKRKRDVTIDHNTWLPYIQPWLGTVTINPET